MSDPRFLQRGFGPSLSHLIEEAGEALAAAGKLQRWGAESVNPLLAAEQQERNIDWLMRELSDVEEAIRRLRSAALQEGYITNDAVPMGALDVLVEALPYVEFSLTDPAYKAGAVQKMVTKMRKAIALAEGKEPRLTDKEKLPNRQRQILNYIALRKNKIFLALPMEWECSKEMMAEAAACVRAGWLEHRNEGFGDEFRLTDAGRAVLAQSQEGADVR
ncbi:hypothetical protein ACRC7T_18205 [Segnochrobactraceae bacterium EtOH-i3]